MRKNFYHKDKCKCLPCKAYRKELYGSKNPAYKNGLPKCIDCNKQLCGYKAKRCKSCSNIFVWATTNKKERVSAKLQGKPLSEERKRKLLMNSPNNSGKNNPMFGVHRFGKSSPCWIDGRSYEKYPAEFNDTLREKIRSRDNYECQNCHMTDEEHIIVYGRHIEIHHIDYNRKNCNETNLITLCKQDNIRANKNREYWQEFYTEKINEKVN